MHKLLPFRQYDEKDVLNLFKLDLESTALTALKPNAPEFNKKNWSGTAVDAGSSNNWYGTDPGGLPTGKDHVAQSYLGQIGTKDQGFSSKWGSFYPEAPMSAKATSSGGGFLGITLRPTLAYDENDEKLLYYNVKKDELQAVIPGEAVPVATRGFFTLTGDAVNGAVVGDILKLGDNGTFTTPTASAITVDSSVDANTDGNVDTGSVTIDSTFGVGRVLAVGAKVDTKPLAIFVQILGGIETA
jgi:hypothetical protein